MPPKIVPHKRVQIEAVLDEYVYDTVTPSLLCETALCVGVSEQVVAESDDGKLLDQLMQFFKSGSLRVWAGVVQDVYRNEDLSRRLLDRSRPPLPNIPDGWLISDMIAQAMRPYELKYRFRFYGPYSAAQKFTLNKMNKDLESAGFVFNTDPKGNGSHWVALFVDLSRGKKKRLEYFDSLGLSPSSAVDCSIQTVLEQLHIHFPRKKFDHPIDFCAVRKQMDTNQCGIFCIFFLVAKLKGFTLEQISGMDVDDEDCKRLRHFFFDVTEPPIPANLIYG
jgi:hypothetical protein